MLHLSPALSSDASSNLRDGLINLNPTLSNDKISDRSCQTNPRSPFACRVLRSRSLIPQLHALCGSSSNPRGWKGIPEASFRNQSHFSVAVRRSTTFLLALLASVFPPLDRVDLTLVERWSLIVRMRANDGSALLDLPSLGVFCIEIS